jgi:CRISPR-associated protein Csb2
MGQHLVLTVRLHDTRYHGAPTSEWPPAPGRLFQALVAGVARGQALPERFSAAFEWLETLPPPIIAAPRQRLGSRVDFFVPNNDADAVGGDPAQVSEIRTKKLVQPRLIEGEPRFEYAWPLAAHDDRAQAIVDAAESVYQLGRGIDMAWAVGEVVDDEKLDARLTAHRGTVHHPHGRTGSKPLACPASGSLTSLVRRHGATRLRPEGEGKSARLLFANAPKPRFVPIAYTAVRHRLVFELRDREHDAKLWPWPLARAVALIERLRDGAADRLRHALPDASEHIDRALIGRKPEGRAPSPITHRVRIVPLPSIGHEHVDRAIRRIVVEIPSACPLRPDDIAWAFTGLETADPDTGIVDPIVLVRATEHDMFARYESSARRWRSITPLALPESAQRRRIEPTKRREEAKDGAERSAEHARAIAAVYTALRHAGLHATVTDVQVQREPFEARGLRAESFAPATRFPKERLWHVDLSLSEPIEGPLTLGDGRFLGLGVMTPVLDATGIFAFDLSGASPGHPVLLCRALRRAVMSRAQAELGGRALGPYFSGHTDDGEPARGDTSSHIAMQFDPVARQLLILAPHVLDHRPIDSAESRLLAVLERALDGFSELRAGAMGVFSVSRVPQTASSPVFGAARVWKSASPYSVNRHRRSASANDALSADVLAECERRGLPRPTVTVLASRGVAGRGLEGRVRLEFAVAVEGPIVLGRSRYLGGGLFVRAGQLE